MSRPRLRIEPGYAPAFEHVLEGDQVVIGRAESADVTVPDSTVSRRHVRVYRQADAWWVEDLGARNRTTLNGHQLDGPTRLRHNDWLRMGDTVVRFLQSMGAPARDDLPAPQAGDGTVFLKRAPVVANAPRSDDREDQRPAARLRLLNEIHRALATPITLPALLDLILERCFEVLRPEQGVILLREPDGILRQAATRRRSDDTGEILVSRRIVEEVAGKGQSALVLDATGDARFSDAESITRSGIRSIAAAPLMDTEGTLGMIALYSRDGVRRFSQEDSDLLVSLASAAALRVRNVALAQEAAARLVLERELSLAHDIQMAMLPRRLPAREEVEVTAVLEPARSVGGDFYDFALHGSALWFILGDVSGKGVGAALYMAVAMTLFRATARGAMSLVDVIVSMNRDLLRDNEDSTFVTALAGCLDCVTGTVQLCDAGHNPPVVIEADGNVRRPVVPKAMALGVADGFPYLTAVVELHPGDTLLLYTDGVTEARSHDGTQFGMDRLERAVAQREATSGSIVDRLVSEVERFAAGASPEDDVAVLAIQYRGQGRSELA